MEGVNALLNLASVATSVMSDITKVSESKPVNTTTNTTVGSQSTVTAKTFTTTKTTMTTRSKRSTIAVE